MRSRRFPEPRLAALEPLAPGQVHHGQMALHLFNCHEVLGLRLASELQQGGSGRRLNLVGGGR